MARKTETADQENSPQLDEDQVVAYLTAHPDLLLNRPELLSSLTPPARFVGETVLDFQLAIIRRLTQELDQMKGCAEHLITTSRSNMSIQSRTHGVALAMLAAGDMEKLLQVIAEDMPAQLDLDIALLAIERPSEVPPTGIVPLPKGTINGHLGAGEVLLRAERPADPAIFGNAASLVQSYALARVNCGRHGSGLLALGSRHERTFHSSQGTELLAFLAQILEDCLSRWWKPKSA
jgi:uncharacterized protein YigA (DUF484 family)